jgi:hypothetical protein
MDKTLQAVLIVLGVIFLLSLCCSSLSSIRSMLEQEQEQEE